MNRDSHSPAGGGGTRSLPPTNQRHTDHPGQEAGYARDIVECNPTGVCVVSAADLRISYTNRAWRDLLRVGDESGVGRALGEMLPAGCEALLGLVTAARDSGASARVSHFRCSDGAGERLWTVEVVPRLDPAEERVEYLLLFVGDAGERMDLIRAADQAAERERRRAEELDAMFASIRDAVLLADPAGRITRFNAAAEALFGLEGLRDLRVDSPPLALTRPRGDGAGVYESALARALRGEVIRGEEALVARPGRPARWVSVTAGPVMAEEGAGGAIAVLHDISDLRETETRLARALRAEQHRARAAGMLYDAAHRLAADLDVRERCRTLAEIMAEATGVGRCCIVMLEGETVQRVTVFADDTQAAERLRQAIRPGERLAGGSLHAARDHSPAYVADARVEPMIEGAGWPDDVRSVLIVPLLYADRVTGVAYLDRPGVEGEFGESEQVLAATIAAQGAVALENARLFEVEQDRARMLEVMIAELNHRVKNNLAIVCGLLTLQLTQSDSQATKESVLRDCITRIQSISLIHQMLHEDNMDAVDMKQTARRIAALACDTFAAGQQRIIYRVRGDELMVPCKLATSLGVAINELVCNAVKHGLAGRAQGRITIGFHCGPQVRITVGDNGRGLPHGFNLTRDGHVGTLVVGGLVDSELGGSFSLRNSPRGGARAMLTFPASALEDRG